MSMFDKTLIRETLLAIERADIAAAQRSYDAYFGEATTVGDRVFDPEHAATVVRDRPVLERIEALAHEHEHHVQTIAAISFGPRVTVGPGAVVQIDDRFVVVAVPAPEFAYGDVRMIGISTHAPLSRAMNGLRVGDAFEFNHRTHTIRGLW
jgi:transcription elongation GreA/GreB family factor